MQEQLISFKTARLAKEKGFQELVSNCYYEGELFGSYAMMSEDDSAFIDVMDGNELENHNHIDFEDRFSAPTQSLLQKWLREKYDILIFPYINFQEKDYFYCSIFPKNGDRFSTEDFLTYEEALEVGLQEALKLIT